MCRRLPSWNLIVLWTAGGLLFGAVSPFIPPDFMVPPFALPGVLIARCFTDERLLLDSGPRFEYLVPANAVFYAVVGVLCGFLHVCFRRTPNARQLQCGQCGYSLRGLRDPRCPECGAPFDPSLLEHEGISDGRQED